MKVRIAHSGHTDLIIQSNGQGTRRLRRMSWWQLFKREYAEFEIGDNELIVIRTDLAVEPDTGRALRNVV